MSNDPSPLKYMGTQSQDTVNEAAAKAQDAILSTQRSGDRAMDTLSDMVDGARRGVGATIDKASDAAGSATSDAKVALQAAARQARDRANATFDMATSYTKDEPIKAMLIAAAAGALLIGLVSVMARSRR